MSFRIQRINELVRQKIGEILVREMSFKSGVFATIAKVDTSPDLRYTRVFLSVFPETDGEYVLKSLEKNLYVIQGRLNKSLTSKILPRVEFQIDLTEAHADEVEKILVDIQREKTE